jgi:hypothetical protein
VFEILFGKWSHCGCLRNTCYLLSAHVGQILWRK